MKYEDIERQWTEDSKIDGDNLFDASMQIPKLHSKWLGILSREKMVMENLKLELEEMSAYARLYYTNKSGDFREKILSKLGKDDFQGVLFVGKDADMMAAIDKAVVAVRKKLALQKEKVDYLNEVVNHIKNRSYLIHNAIEWRKFTSGD